MANGAPHSFILARPREMTLPSKQQDTPSVHSPTALGVLVEGEQGPDHEGPGIQVSPEGSGSRMCFQMGRQVAGVAQPEGYGGVRVCQKRWPWMWEAQTTQTHLLPIGNEDGWGSAGVQCLSSGVGRGGVAGGGKGKGQEAWGAGGPQVQCPVASLQRRRERA